MKLIVSFILIVFIGGCTAAADDIGPTDTQSDVPPVVLEYFQLLDSVYRAGSSQADISNFLALMTDDVRYVHRNYGANFDLNSWNEAFSRIQNNGGYDKSDEFCTAITNNIPGNSYHAIEYAVGQKSDGICIASDVDRMLVVFKFSEEKIQSIEELW